MGRIQLDPKLVSVREQLRKLSNSGLGRGDAKDPEVFRAEVEAMEAGYAALTIEQKMQLAARYKPIHEEWKRLQVKHPSIPTYTTLDDALRDWEGRKADTLSEGQVFKFQYDSLDGIAVISRQGDGYGLELQLDLSDTRLSSIIEHRVSQIQNKRVDGAGFRLTKGIGAGIGDTPYYFSHSISMVMVGRKSAEAKGKDLYELIKYGSSILTHLLGENHPGT